jgi:hypothetical protein
MICDAQLDLIREIPAKVVGRKRYWLFQCQKNNEFISGSAMQLLPVVTYVTNSQCLIAAIRGAFVVQCNIWAVGY